MKRKDLPFLAVDDFAWRKGTNYGTLICDLKTGRPLDLLPDRSKETLTAWLKEQSQVHIVSRDGSVTYKNAIREAGDFIIQITDRFHYLSNLNKHMSEALKRIIPRQWQITKDPTKEEKTDVSASTNESFPEDPTPLTPAETEKWSLIQELQQKHKQGHSIRSLARTYKMSRETVNKYLKAEAPLRYSRKKKQDTLLQPYLSLIYEQIDANSTSMQIYKLIQNEGYEGSYSTVRLFTSAARKSDRSCSDKPKEGRFYRKHVIPLYWKLHQQLSEKEMKLLNLTLRSYPETKELYGFVQMFREEVAHLDSTAIKRLLLSSKTSNIAEIRSFVSFLIQDIDAVMASIHYTYSNGVIEGQINRLKVLKRMMYGRASFELLRKRVLTRV